MNSLGVIFPYKRNGVWAFDDAAVGLLQEPFVLGIPEMIEELVRDIPNAESGFTLYFSSSPFPRYSTVVERVREESGGNWYRDPRSGREGWLCPALFRYFDAAPERLYVMAAPKAA